MPYSVYDYLQMPAGMGPAQPILAPLQLGLAAYHQPTYGVPSLEEQQLILEELRNLREQRGRVANDYASRVNEAVKGRNELLNDSLDSLTATLSAIAQNNQASAEARRAASDYLQEVNRVRSGYSAGTAYQIPKGVPDEMRRMMADNSNALVAEGSKLNLGDLNADAQESAVRGVMERQILGIQQVGMQYLGGTQNAGMGDLVAARDTGVENIVAGLSRLKAEGLDPAVADRLMTEYTTRYAQSISETPLSQGILASSGDLLAQSEADRRAFEAKGNELARGFGLDPGIIRQIKQASDQVMMATDITDPGAYTTLVRSASDAATAPLADLLADMKSQEGAYQRSLEVTDDPFFSTLRRFSEKHPWYATWMRSQGFRHHQEAVRWLLNNPDTIGTMDQQWTQIQQERESPELENNPLGEGALVTPRELRERLRSLETPEGKARIAGQGMNTNPFGRMLAEIGGMFRRDPGFARSKIPDAPRGSGLSGGAFQQAGGQGSAQFGAQPYWRGKGYYSGDPRNAGTGGSVLAPPESPGGQSPGAGQSPGSGPVIQTPAPGGAQVPTPGTPVSARPTETPEERQARTERARAELNPYVYLQNMLENLRFS